jgi:SAM-dependent methyltransferase
VELEKKWQHRFSYRALRFKEPHEISHWTKQGFRIRKKIIGQQIQGLYKKGQRILDLGSGPGPYAQYFDSPVLLDYSRQVFVRRPGQVPCHPVCGDFNALPFPENTFDGVLSVGLLQCRRLKREDLKKFALVLKKGSWFLFETLNCEWRGLADEMSPEALSRIKKEFKTNGRDACYIVLDDFVLYHAQSLIQWFEQSGLSVLGLKYLYILGQPLKLLEEPLHAFRLFNFSGRQYAKSFYIFGKKE